jgi:F-type H+-transporting ATPase subunit a
VENEAETTAEHAAEGHEVAEIGADALAEHSEGGFNIHPMDQFVVKPLFGGDEVHWYTITNQTLWLAIALGAIFLLLIYSTRGRALVPTRAQSFAEVVYGFVHKMIEDITGKQGLKYFPYIFTIFLFIIFANVLGLLPYSFTTTSHIALTGVLAVMVFVAVTVIGFVKHGAGFLKLFWISSAPLVLRPILLIIEVISYFVRPVSHSIRLAGNMMAGHAVIKVFAGFAGAMGVGAVLPIFAIVAVYGLEMLVTVIQAYVFTILTCVYLNDALHPGH